jgi:hypothetical protein
MCYDCEHLSVDDIYPPMGDLDEMVIYSCDLDKDKDDIERMLIDEWDVWHEAPDDCPLKKEVS